MLGQAASKLLMAAFWKSPWHMLTRQWHELFLGTNYRKMCVFKPTHLTGTVHLIKLSLPAGDHSFNDPSNQTDLLYRDT